MKHFSKCRLPILLGLLALIYAPFMYAPWVQAQTAPHSPAGIQIQSCHRLCVKGGESCLGQTGGTEPYCDTLEIGCIWSCNACIGGFDICINRDDQTPRFCQSSFNACLEQKLTASRARARSQIVFKGGDGLSRETAVVIDGALSEAEGILAESLWVSRHHPDWRKRDQMQMSSDGKHFDDIDYTAADGPHAIWYDITGFFGK